MPLKVFTSCPRNAIFNFLAANNYIEREIQKGFTPGLSGTFEHTAQMADIINKARTKQRSLVITLLDLKNAFGEVHHNLIQTALDYHHIPDHIKSLVKSLYTDFKTSILTNAFRISWTIDRQVYFQAKAKTYIIHLKPPARRFHFLILPSLQVENKYKITLHNKNHVFFCRSCFMKSLNS